MELYRFSIVMKKIILQYTYVFIALIFVFALIRFLEYSYIWFIGNNESISLELLFGRSINFDTLFVVNLSLILILPYVILGSFSKLASHILLYVMAFLIIVIHLLLTSYFLLSWNILDSTVFEFSLDELSKIVLAEISKQNLSLLIGLVVVLMSVIYLLFSILPKVRFSKRINIFLVSVYLIFCVVSIFNIHHTSKSIKYFENNYLYYLGNSKEVFFIKSLSFDSDEADNLKNIDLISERYHKANPYFNYCDNNYPLVHNESYNNVLGKYFVKDSTIKPNIVIIICESLSTFFSGNSNCLASSLTPFVDSLAMHSLYWDNFVSNAQRSYGVIPNVLASLPSGIGNRGFINMQPESSSIRRYPQHTSLIEILKRNNYKTSYLYGGWGYFDNVGFFLKENKLDNFVSKNGFDERVLHELKDDNGWGYNDKDVFSKSFFILDEKKVAQPFLNIYQTLSLHSPYNLSEKKYYSQKYIDERVNSLGISRDDIAKIPDNILSSIFFSDDALKDYFNTIKDREEFSNTIFIITGDHSLGLNISNNIFENYRVPLIIYSKLLQAPSKFKGVCSHIDIIPSIIGLLKQNYGLQVSNTKQWLGAGLDTSKYFTQERNIPLVINSSSLPQYINFDKVIFRDVVYSFDSLFNITKVTDSTEITKSKQLFNDYKLLNNYICSKNKIWSPNLQCQ